LIGVEAVFKKFGDWLNGLVSRYGAQSRFIPSAIFLIIVSPVILVAAFSYVQTYWDLTGFTLSRRQAIAYLTAATLRGNLDRLKDISVSLATRVRFRQLVSEGKWDGAIQILEDVPKNFPFIDRLFLADLDGTLMADTPALPGVRGKNFAYRDWYKGVSSHGQPYISEVYKRAAEPELNVIAVAAPIKTEDQKVAGLLVLQVRLNILLEWASHVDVGPSGFVFLVDRQGHVAAHPKFAPDREIMNLSAVPTVQKALRGERGVEIAFNPIEKEEQIAAYEPVPGYGWGVIAQEPTSAAFATRNSSLRRLLLTYGFIALISLFLAYLILRTLAERKRVAEEILDRNKQIEEANKELEAFSYSVSHDLRAPLRAMDGFSRILLEKYSSHLAPEALGYVGRVRANAKQMGQLIDDLLAFSRLGRQPLRREEIIPTDIIRHVLQDLQQEQAGRRAEISVGDLPPCKADPALLKQVFVNLLSNALKFTRERDVARIEVGCRQTEDGPVYFVKDNGVGFDMRYADKLFGIFQRLHRIEEYDGTGVGLAIVQRIVHRHDGRVWAEAEVNRGATFYFTLGGGAVHD
jgi:signal transduction histidine kinase